MSKQSSEFPDEEYERAGSPGKKAKGEFVVWEFCRFKWRWIAVRQQPKWRKHRSYKRLRDAEQVIRKMSRESWYKTSTFRIALPGEKPSCETCEDWGDHNENE